MQAAAAGQKCAAQLSPIAMSARHVPAPFCRSYELKQCGPPPPPPSDPGADSLQAAAAPLAFLPSAQSVGADEDSFAGSSPRSAKRSPAQDELAELLLLLLLLLLPEAEPAASSSGSPLSEPELHSS